MNSKAEPDYQVKTRDAWYKHYPRDYIEGTRRLTLEERGAYADIIDLLYIHGGKLPDDQKWMGCAMHISTRKWRAIRDALIAHKKIESVDGHIVNARVAFELHSRSVQARTNAETATNRERTKRENREKINEINETDARKQHHIRVRVREEEKESQSPNGDSSETAPKVDLLLPPEPPVTDILQRAVDAWNETATKTGLPRVRILSPDRRKKLAARLKDAGGLDGWKEALARLAASDFLTGKVKGWKADFGFVLQQESFAKLVEGSYDNRNEPRRGRLPESPNAFLPWQPTAQDLANMDEANRRAEERERRRRERMLTQGPRLNQH